MKSRAFARDAFTPDLNPTTMQIHNLLGNFQTQSCPGFTRLAACFATEEALEQLFLFV